MVRRNAILGLAALLAATGCNAGTSNGLRRSEPPVTREAISTTRIIAQINKNAASIDSLMADSSMVVDGDGQSVRLDGKLAMERPKDFRFDIRFHGRPEADIGSNEKGFWFWLNDKKDKAIYVCDYANAGANPLGVTMQPDWILEAMGLREITEREANTIQASKGDRPGQLVLTQLRTDPRGGSLTKVTVVDEKGEILEHRLYAGAKEKLLARATISQTQHIDVGSTEAGTKGTVVSFPAKIKLEWVVEKFTLNITMGRTSINPEFPETQRAFLFNEPKLGVERRDLARLNGNAQGAASSSIYESDPRPGIRSGIRLGKPESEPTGVEGASFDQSSRAQAPADLASLPTLPSEYVGPQVPTAPESEAVRAAAVPGFGRGTFRQ